MAEQVKILELSDGLGRLADDLEQFVRGGLTIDGGTVVALVYNIRRFHRLSRALENEISRYRWNECARKDRDAEAQAIAAEVARPGSNVTLFPAMQRIAMGDLPEGAA